VVFGATHADIAEEVDQLAQPALVKTGARVVLGEHAFEPRIVTFDGLHRAIN
jgi:hypothetical protein